METENVYSLSNKETNYKGLSNCVGNSQEILLKNLLFQTPALITLDLGLVYNGSNLQDIFCAVKNNIRLWRQKHRKPQCERLRLSEAEKSCTHTLTLQRKDFMLEKVW